MTRADDAILEFLLNGGNTPLNATLAVIQANIEYQISHVRNRIRKLHSAGLLEYHDEERGIYHTSQKGHEYLLGDLDANDIRISDE